MATWQKVDDQWILIDPRSQAETLLPQVPDDLLWPARNADKRGERQRQLLLWFEKRGVFPTLAELEAERDRRGRDRGVKRSMRPHWEPS